MIIWYKIPIRVLTWFLYMIFLYTSSACFSGTFPYNIFLHEVPLIFSYVFPSQITFPNVFPTSLLFSYLIFMHAHVLKSTMKMNLKLMQVQRSLGNISNVREFPIPLSPSLMDIYRLWGLIQWKISFLTGVQRKFMDYDLYSELVQTYWWKSHPRTFTGSGVNLLYTY